MGALAVPALIASTAITALGQYRQGQYQGDVGNLQAKLSEQQANESAAVGQRRAAEAYRQGRRTTSRAMAVAAASGAGASDKTVQDVVGDLEARSEYSALAELYKGRTAEADARTQAEAFRSGGKYSRNQGILNATGTLLQGGSTLYERFGASDTPSSTQAYTPDGYNPIDLNKMKL